MRCVKMCPAQALDEKDYPQGLTDKKSCTAHSAELNQRGISPCGICIKVCPVGEDRKALRAGGCSIYTRKDRVPGGAPGLGAREKIWRAVRSRLSAMIVGRKMVDAQSAFIFILGFFESLDLFLDISAGLSFVSLDWRQIGSAGSGCLLTAAALRGLSGAASSSTRRAACTRTREKEAGRA